VGTKETPDLLLVKGQLVFVPYMVHHAQQPGKNTVFAYSLAESGSGRGNTFEVDALVPGRRAAVCCERRVIFKDVFFEAGASRYGEYWDPVEIAARDSNAENGVRARVHRVFYEYKNPDRLRYLVNLCRFVCEISDDPSFGMDNQFIQVQPVIIDPCTNDAHSKYFPLITVWEDELEEYFD
jgi:hypothetical protein